MNNLRSFAGNLGAIILILLMFLGCAVIAAIIVDQLEPDMIVCLTATGAIAIFLFQLNVRLIRLMGGER